MDTADRRLAAGGWACRLRSRGEVRIISLKGPPIGDPEQAGGQRLGIQRRRELEGPALPDPDPGTWPRSDAADLLVRLTAGSVLIERFTLRQVRTQRSVTIGDRMAGTLSLDRVSVVRGRTVIGRFREVELELVPDEPIGSAEIAALFDGLAAITGLHADGRSKLQWAEAMLDQRSFRDPHPASFG
jgi:inorganic triphosphatase YgiF